MQHKHGNPRRRPRKSMDSPRAKVQLLEVVSLTLHHTDPVTGQEDALYTLFYEYYRGYTIYSNKQGQCCIHGLDGCLRIEGKYVAFPDVEQAKNMIKHFQADGRTPQESMNRFVPEDEYRCMNMPRRKQSTLPTSIGA
jgi:hypothetical protein